MAEKVLYFGYGANRDPRMMAAILGLDDVESRGKPGTLEGYKLAVQRLDQVPDSVQSSASAQISPRDVLKENWSDDFTSYVITPDSEGSVAGTIWELTPDERERVRDWELVDFGWYEDCEGVAFDNEGNRVSIISERLGPEQKYDHEVNGLKYETWLNPPERFEIIAEKARREYDERLRGLEGSSTKPDINNV